MRTTTTWGPLTALARLDREFDAIIGAMWAGEAAPENAHGRSVPAAEITLDGDDALITIEIPGVDAAADLELTVADGRLIVGGQRRPGASSAGRTLLSELRHGPFRREFTLPEHVTADAIEATYDRGLLHLRIRNLIEPVPEPRRIPVTISPVAATREEPELEGPQP